MLWFLYENKGGMCLCWLVSIWPMFEHRMYGRLTVTLYYLQPHSVLCSFVGAPPVCVSIEYCVCACVRAGGRACVRACVGGYGVVWCGGVVCVVCGVWCVCVCVGVTYWTLAFRHPCYPSGLNLQVVCLQGLVIACAITLVKGLRLNISGGPQHREALRQTPLY